MAARPVGGRDFEGHFAVADVEDHTTNCRTLPEHELSIERRARSSESFRAICEEYAEGVEALERWQQAAGRAGAVAELGASLAELEEELLEQLRAAAAPLLRRQR